MTGKVAHYGLHALSNAAQTKVNKTEHRPVRKTLASATLNQVNGGIVERMLIWVNAGDFVGECRRAVQRGFRLTERRKRNLAEALPSLPTLLRQLKLHDLSASDGDRIGDFRVRLTAASALANSQGETVCAGLLDALMVFLDTAPRPADLEVEVASVLARASIAIGSDSA
jgi:hypothetical protein